MPTSFPSPAPFPPLAAVLALALPAAADPSSLITWFSDPNKTNLTATGTPLDATFRFELGVFTGTFVPTPANIDRWADHWVAAQRTAYVPTTGATGSFTANHPVANNESPFTPGKRAYVWGFNPAYQDAQWILFGDPSWTWPAADPFGLPLAWNAADAAGPGEAVLGAVDPDGTPFLLQTASVPIAAPPPTSWDQWRADSFTPAQLTDPLVSGPHADPDADGLTNVGEYACATPPLARWPSAAATALVLTIGADRHLAIEVPVKSDRAVDLAIGVSTTLAAWDESPAATVLVSASPTARLFRSVEPLAARPAQFLRARFALPK